MRVLDETELKNTRQKLLQLQALYAQTEQEAAGDEELREMELESLARLINQLKEEIARSESRLHQV
jgi:hypothetical protein